MNNTCICCGEPIPEGRQVCPECEKSKKDHIEKLAADIYSMLRSDTMSRAMASLLYGEGYRRQSEGEWMPKHHISRSPRGRYISYNTYSCDVCGKSNGRQRTPFRPNCGAKMKGGE